VAKTGYSEGRISTLHADPTFQELIATYRKQVDAAFVASIDEYFEVATSNMLVAERMIAEKLIKAEEEDDLPSFKDLHSISRDAADRFGYGKKTTNVNVNIDFAAKLERARSRSSMKTIESVAGQPAVGRDGQPGSGHPGAGSSFQQPIGAHARPHALPNRIESPSTNGGEAHHRSHLVGAGAPSRKDCSSPFTTAAQSSPRMKGSRSVPVSRSRLCACSQLELLGSAPE
jgi:hypothetical protein